MSMHMQRGVTRLLFFFIIIYILFEQLKTVNNYVIRLHLLTVYIVKNRNAYDVTFYEIVVLILCQYFIEFPKNPYSGISELQYVVSDFQTSELP